MAPTKTTTSAQQQQAQQQQKKAQQVPAKTMAKTAGPHKPKNAAINAGKLMKYSRARIFQRKAAYKVKKVKAPAAKKEAAKQVFTVKKIGGEKNGGERKVFRKTSKSFPTQVRQRRANLRPKKTFKKHVRHIRPNLTPGSVLIVLAGRHKGKRVVLLKVLESGLLLVTGPRKLNGCPLRRVSQRYVIGTRTRIDIKGVALPDRLNDAYFRRQKTAKTSKKAATGSGGDIFAKTESNYTLSAERREDQTAVDKAVMAAIKASGEGAMLRSYLRSLFSLGNGQKPHQMVF